LHDRKSKEGKRKASAFFSSRLLDGSGSSQQVIWDAKNLSGKLFASGTCVVLLVADGRNVLKRPYKVGIVR
jgi:hypothetical protein